MTRGVPSSLLSCAAPVSVCVFRERFLYLGALKVLPNKETAPACVCVSSHLENFKIFPNNSSYLLYF